MKLADGWAIGGTSCGTANGPWSDKRSLSEGQRMRKYLSLKWISEMGNRVSEMERRGLLLKARAQLVGIG